MTDAPAAPDVYQMSPAQATAALAQKTAEYKAAQATAAAGAVPPPPGRPATSPGQAAARLAQLKASPDWRAKVLTGSPAQAAASSARYGPSPTTARRAPGSRRSMAGRRCSPFSMATRPTYSSRKSSGPAPSRARQAAERCAGENCAVSTPRDQ